MVKRLCNMDCNNCEVWDNEQLAVLLNVLALRFGKEVWYITNYVCPNMTCCPTCHVDDFCHYDDDDGAFVTPINRVMAGHRTCDVAAKAREVFEVVCKKEEEKCE